MSPADASAFETAAAAAAKLYAVEPRSGCNIPAACLPLATSARAWNTPDSNIALSTLEAVAFSSLARDVQLQVNTSNRRRVASKN
jgi:hypothetical protein